MWDLARIAYLGGGGCIPTCDLRGTNGDSERTSMFELIRVLLHLDIKPLTLSERRSRRLCYETTERFSRKSWIRYSGRISGPMRRAFLRYLYTNGDHLLLRNLGKFEETRASMVRLEEILVFMLHKRHPTLCTLPQDILKASWKQQPLHVVTIQDSAQYFEERELWMLVDYLLFYARRQYQGFYVYRMSIRQLVAHWHTMRRFVSEAVPSTVPSVMMGLHVFGYLIQRNLLYGSVSTVTRGCIQAESERLPVMGAVPDSFGVDLHAYMVTPIPVNIPGRCLENHFSETVNNGRHFDALL